MKIKPSVRTSTTTASESSVSLPPLPGSVHSIVSIFIFFSAKPKPIMAESGCQSLGDKPLKG